MPIRFRCTACSKLLGIASRKAGTETTCPQCGTTLTVPTAHEGENPINLDDIDVILVGTPAAPPRPAPAARPVGATPSVAKAPSGERPLFETDVDAVLGVANPAPTRPDPPKPKPQVTAGKDALSLDGEEPRIVLSSQKATAAIVGIVVLMVASFVAGVLVGSR